MKLIKEKYVDKDIKVASNIKRIMFKSDGIPTWILVLLK